MNKPIVIQGALQSEIDFLLEKVKINKKEFIGNYIFYECIYKNYPVIISKIKIGEISSAIATTLCIKNYSPLFIINEGTAGALVNWLNKGDIVIGNKIYYISQFSTEEDKETDDNNPWKNDEYKTIDNEIVSYEANKKLLDWLKGLKILNKKNIYFDIIGSGDVWTKNTNQILEYNKKYGVVCEAMECSGAYISANSLNTPLVSIRVISNNELKNQSYDEKTSLHSQKLALDIIDEFIEKFCVKG